MGFSPLGLAVSLAVFAPNLILAWFPPRTPLPAAKVPRALGWLERAGQVLCLVVPAITPAGVVVWWWAPFAMACLGVYYGLWARYLATGRSGDMLYRPLWRIPVPMAVLPVAVFLAAAGWLSNIWIAVAAMVLAAGHIPVAVIVARVVLR